MSVARQQSLFLRTARTVLHRGDDRPEAISTNGDLFLCLSTAENERITTIRIRRASAYSPWPLIAYHPETAEYESDRWRLMLTTARGSTLNWPIFDAA